MSGPIEEIKKERERFVAFAFAAAEIFFEVNAKGKIVFEGGATERVGLDAGSLIGEPLVDQIDEDDRDVYAALQQHLTHKGRIGPIPLRFISQGGRSVALRLFALKMPGEDSHTFLALRAAPLGGGGVDGATDAETGLLQRDSFMELASRTMKENPAGSNLYMTAVEVEGIEDAKKKFGPKYMRHLLKQVAAHLKTLSVDGEIAGQIGEKHFAFLHRAKSDGSQIGSTLEHVDKNVTLKTAYSTLASDMPKEGTEDQVLRTLTYVLNQFVKDPGAVDFDSLSVAYEDMASEAQRRVVGMRQMIETGTFKMAFQPVYSLSTNEVHHNEVLSRFDDRMGDRSTLDIIRFAEEVGIIEEFDIALCHKAIDYVKKMKKLGNPLTLAVNISGRTLDNSRYTDKLMKEFIAGKDAARNILVELTETATIENLEKVEAILNDLKAMDYRICLDDFGAGAAGYQYLRAFNVDYVKIDGSYVEDMNTPGYRPTFLLSIVRLCNDLGVKTIGEHVENRFQADFLRSLGVDFAQGFHFGKPDHSPHTD